MTEQVVELRVWQIPRRAIPAALALMSWQPLALRRNRHVRFAKVLGTGAGRQFTSKDADWQHWALLTVATNQQQAAQFARSKVMKSWQVLATECLHLELSTITSQGFWSGRQPFISNPRKWSGPVAAITRARIKPQQWRAFGQAVPPVATDLQARDDDLLFRIGIGEAPVGLQGTFSVWKNSKALNNFAYKSPAHQQVIATTKARNWYAEELFARFGVLSTTGSYRGANPLAEQLEQ